MRHLARTDLRNFGPMQSFWNVLSCKDRRDEQIGPVAKSRRVCIPATPKIGGPRGQLPKMSVELGRVAKRRRTAI
jgi:hypothetical protein